MGYPPFVLEGICGLYENEGGYTSAGIVIDDEDLDILLARHTGVHRESDDPSLRRHALTDRDATCFVGRVRVTIEWLDVTAQDIQTYDFSAADMAGECVSLNEDEMKQRLRKED